MTNGLKGAAVACARLLTASSMSYDSITSVSTPLVCAAVDVEMRFGAAGSGGAGCPSWALASIGPSSFFGEGGREVRREESVTCRKKARYARPSLGQGRMSVVTLDVQCGG